MKLIWLNNDCDYIINCNNTEKLLNCERHPELAGSYVQLGTQDRCISLAAALRTDWINEECFLTSSLKSQRPTNLFLKTSFCVCYFYKLRSSDNFKCTITGTSSRLGDRAFAAAGPCLRNSLPTHVRRPDLSLDTFRGKLKTYLAVRGTST